jgi:hypothetical protein
MHRNTFRLFAVLFCAMFLFAGIKSQAQDTSQGGTPGIAIGNGSVFHPGSRLTIFSSMASRLGNYAGSVYVFGFTRGHILFIAVPLYNPVFSGDDTTSTCTATNDMTFDGVTTQITFTWNQNLDGTAPNSLSWQIVAYNDGDDDGNPTGDVLFDTGTVTLNGGQVVVKQPN